MFNGFGSFSRRCYFCAFSLLSRPQLLPFLFPRRWFQAFFTLIDLRNLAFCGFVGVQRLGSPNRGFNPAHFVRWTHQPSAAAPVKP